MSEGVLQDKAVIVTGAGQGIGAATARLAASEGASVLINDIDSALAEAVAASIRDGGGQADTGVADLTDWSSGEALVSRCIERFGRLDGLVNNAGIFRTGLIDEITPDDMTALFRVNVLGTAACAQAAVRHMRAAGSGSIVNIVSGAQCGMPGLGAYGATKGAVATMTYSWAVELAGSGVRINAVSPLADTAMADATSAFSARAFGKPRGAFPKAAENAPAICYLLSDLSAAIHGQVVRTAGEVLALMTHPAVLGPVLTRPEWTIAATDAAFREQLTARQQPLGIVTVPGE